MSMQTVIRGRVWKYGDNVNTDVIFPGKYTYTVRDREQMGKHALEDLDPSFAAQMRPGDVDRRRTELGLRQQPRAGRRRPESEGRRRDRCQEHLAHLL